MKFGELPLHQAEGAILAHTHRLDTGTLKKGRRLSAADLAALTRANYTHVIAARLDPTDILEDEAAATVARAISGEHITIAEASTGRANLFAATRGLLHFDAGAVTHLNLADPAITVATLAPSTLVEPEDMIATVKIIPFAVPREALDRALLTGRAWLNVAPLRPHKVALLQTRIPDMPDAQLDRASESQRARIAHLGSTLVRELRCAHTEAAVTESLHLLLDGGIDLLLALGASATCDIRDVIPSAIAAAGGAVDHLGMPVDPGNLLFLGRLRGIPVIGVPGCARSLKRSGFDTVLERTLAKIPTTALDLARMGAGGLLSEIEHRPSPRAGTKRAPARIAAIVLAAGMSKRMGTNKLLEALDGRPLVTRAVDALLASKLDRVFVVTGHEREKIEAALAGRAVTFVFNPAFAEGMSTSLRAGIHALDDTFDAAAIALGDMPLVREDHIARLLAAFDPHGPATIWVPTFQEKRGHPVLLSARHFPEVNALSGDVGARSILERHRDHVAEVPIEDEAVRIDIDTPEALQAARAQSTPD